MLSRHDISDDHWNRIAHLLPGQAGGHGGVGDDTRLFVNAIRYRAKTGIAWADLPTCYGKSNSLWQRYNRWCQRCLGNDRRRTPRRRHRVAQRR
jgi:putative transposase